MPSKCIICGESNEIVLEEHHLIPRRFGGDERDENIVTLCANCHAAIEHIYDAEFWERVPAYLNETKYIDPNRSDKEYALQALAKLHRDIKDYVEFTSDFCERANVSVAEVIESNPETVSEAVQYERGKILAYSTVSSLIDELQEEIGIVCIRCGNEVEKEDLVDRSADEGFPSDLEVEFMCSQCAAF